MSNPSALRARLASFEHAYVVAIRLRIETGADQYVVRTGNPLQPVRVVSEPTSARDGLLALVV